MEDACSFFDTLASGINSIFAYDNIAIAVLMAMVIFLLYWINKILNIQITRDSIIKDVLSDMKTTIAVLNERLSHRIDEHDDNSGN